MMTPLCLFLTRICVWEILFILIPLLQLGNCVWFETLVGKDIGLWVPGLETRKITAEFGPNFWPLGIMKIKQAQTKETVPFLPYKFKLN